MDFTKLIIASIKELLINNGYVIIPEWGAFLCTKRTAYLNKEKNSIEPPSYNIIFNPNMKKDDGILTSHLLNKTNISLYELNQLIKDTIKEWDLKLSLNKKLTLNDFGILQIEGKNYRFEPFRNLIFPEYYGLKPISLNKFLSEEQIIFHILPSVSYNFLKLIILVPLISGLLFSPIKINNPLKKFSFINLNIEENKKEKKVVKKTPLIQQKIDSVVDLSEALVINDFNNDSTSEDTVIITQVTKKEIDSIKINIENKELTNKKNITTKQNKYFIVIGSFKSINEAEYFYNIKIKKYNSLKIIESDKNIRVAIGPYNTREEANFSMKEYKNKYTDFIGWVLNY